MPIKNLCINSSLLMTSEPKLMLEELEVTTTCSPPLLEIPLPSCDLSFLSPSFSLCSLSFSFGSMCDALKSCVMKGWRDFCSKWIDLPFK